MSAGDYVLDMARPSSSDAPVPDLPQWRSLSLVLHEYLTALGMDKQEVHFRINNFMGTLVQIFGQNLQNKEATMTAEDVHGIMFSDEFSTTLRARISEGASTSSSGPSDQERWERCSELEEHNFGELCNLDLRRKLQRLVSAGQTMTTVNLGQLQRPLMDQRPTSKVTGIIGESRLGSENDLFLRLDSIEVRLLFVARSNSTLEELDALYPKGARIRITKHYQVEDEMDTFLVVDNPENIEIETCFPTQLGEFEQMTSQQLRSLGSEYFLKKLYVSAMELYNLSASRSGNPRDKLLALSNASECQLALGQFFPAFKNSDDCLALSAQVGDFSRSAYIKLLTRKARALHGMLEYHEAVRTYMSALSDCSKEQRSSILQYMDKSEQTDVRDDVFRYLNNGCRSADAPTFPDYVGPIEIRARDDGGIGVFATKDIAEGTLLLLSNAVGYVEQGAHINPQQNCADVFVEVLRAALNSPRIALQLKLLSKKLFSSSDENPDVPDMKIFAPNSNLAWPGDHPLDIDKIWEILRYYSRAGILGGIWILPGFITHRCQGNLCMVQVGRAKLFRAVHDIGAGTELAYCYTPALEMLPVTQRRGLINCFCTRCGRETMLKQLFDPYGSLTARYGRLLQEYVRATDVNPRSLRQFLVEEGMIRVAAELERILAASTLELSCKDVLRMSFSVSYLLYLVYKASATGDVVASMPSDEGILQSFAGSTSVNLETLETISAGFFPMAAARRQSTEADRWIDSFFERRYGRSLPVRNRVKFLQWLQSDEPDKARRA